MQGSGRSPSEQEQRRADILELLARQGYVRLPELARRLAVSPETAHRDLLLLARRGLLVRVRGGAVSGAAERSGPGTRPLEHAEAIGELAGRVISPEQWLIAERAAGLVMPGASVAIASGVIGVALAGHLADVPGLTVVTNSVGVFGVFSRLGRSGQEVVLSGGVRAGPDALAGRVAEAALSLLHVGHVFIAPDGISLSDGFGTAETSLVGVHRILMEGMGVKVVMADSTRWEAAPTVPFASLAAADVLISGGGLSPPARDRLRAEIGQLVE
ncbi:DeoR/GlpR family DNA-binding transcription regulator [Actinoplanes sp. NPDC000266]